MKKLALQRNTLIIKIYGQLCHKMAPKQKTQTLDKPLGQCARTKIRNQKKDNEKNESMLHIMKNKDTYFLCKMTDQLTCT